MKLSIILLTTIVLLLFVINFFVSLVIYLGEDYHVIDQIKIYEVFQEHTYKRIREMMMMNNYTILIGDDNTGIKNFIEHQANLQTLEGQSVVIKRYQSQSSSKRALFNKIKQTRFYLELALGLERQERTEVFFVENSYQIPYEEVEFIKTRYPEDNIIIVTPKDLGINIEGFSIIPFPPVTTRMLRLMAAHFYRMKNDKIDAVFEKSDYQIEKIFQYFRREAKKEDITAEQLLQIEQIEEMNQMSHDIAEDQQKRLIDKTKKKGNKQKKEEKQNKKKKREKK